MTGASRSMLATSTPIAPYWPREIPAIPTTAWAIIPSAGDRRGREGIAGRSGVTVSTNSAAARASRWGRLPTPVAIPDGSSTFIGCSSLPNLLVRHTLPGRWRPQCDPRSRRLASRSRAGQVWWGDRARAEQVVTWLARTIWLLLPLAIGPAVAGAIDGRSGLVRAVTMALLWAGWGAVLVALLLPTSSTLTVVRATVPLATVVAVVAWCAGSESGRERCWRSPGRSSPCWSPSAPSSDVASRKARPTATRAATRCGRRCHCCCRSCSPGRCSPRRWWPGRCWWPPRCGSSARS